MPMVMNATKEKVSTKIHGKWFTFAPNSTKLMNPEMCQFISMERPESGLAVLPHQFDPENDGYVEGFMQTQEGKLIVEHCRQQAIDKLVMFHRDIIKNNQVSLRKDLARADEKVDPAVEASPGELESMKIVARYMRDKEDTEQKKIDQVKDLMKSVGTI